MAIRSCSHSGDGWAPSLDTEGMWIRARGCSPQAQRWVSGHIEGTSGTHPQAKWDRWGLCPRDAVGSEGTSQAIPGAVRQAVGGGCQSGWGAVAVGYKCH